MPPSSIWGVGQEPRTNRSRGRLRSAAERIRMATTMKRSAAIRGDVLWATEARKGRARLYPLTALYTAVCLAVFVRALRGTHALAALGWAMAGILTWTLVEYLTHRYVLHGR